MLGLPKSTEFNRRIPKQKFYENIDISPMLKRVFVDQIKIIYWRNKIAPTTVNIAPGEKVTEIEVFEIKLTDKMQPEPVLRQIDKSIEESAYDMGANSFKVFMTVTLPLIKDSFLSGLVTAFVRSITAISAIILLVTPSYLLITVQINEFAEKGSYGLACAFATILIVITYGSVLLMNLVIKYFGTSRKVQDTTDE